MARGSIPVFATAVLSFRFVWTHWRELLRIGWFSVLALLIVTLGLDSFDDLRGGRGSAVADLTRWLLDLGGHTIIATVVLVSWHRLVSTELTGKPSTLSLAFGPREWRYFLVWIGLSVAFVAVAAAVLVALVMVQFLAMLLLYLFLLILGFGDALVVGQRDQFVVVLWISLFFAVPVASYVTGRLLLVLPALALDRRRPLRDAWRLSAGNGWRLVIATMMVLVPVQSVAALFANAAAAARDTMAYYPLAVAAAVFLFLLIVLTGTVLSLFSLQLDTAGRDEESYRPEIAAAE